MKSMKKVLLFSVCAILLFTGCGSKKSDTKNTEVKVKDNKIDGISYSYVINDNDEIILSLKNDTKDIIDYVYIDFAMFDSQKNLINVEKNFARNLSPNQENIVKVMLKNSVIENSILPSKAEIAMSTIKYETRNDELYYDKVEGKVDKTDNEGQLLLTITNNSGVVLDEVNAAVVFYKKGKIIDAQIINMQNVEGSHTEDIYVPIASSNDTTPYIDYDDIKVIINNASRHVEPAPAE